MKASVGSRILDRLGEFAEALENREVISEQFTSRRVVLDLSTTPYDPEMVRKTREVLRVSQAVFAQFLGVSVKTVRAWEQGINAPSAMACRFMDEIRRDPTYWRERLKNAVRAKTGRAKGKSATK